MRRASLAWFGVIVLAVLSAAFATGDAAVAQPRVLGLDVSAWQGNIAQSTWNNIRNVEDRQFVFIRSSRGGTTGFYNQSDPNNLQGQNTLSQRYDDPYFVQNITRATNAGIFAGSYHFARPDIVASTQNSGGIANSGDDEADHMIQMAGAWMRPGYLLPVFDLEAGQSQRTRNQLAQFSIDFSDRIYEEMGIRPIMYINGNYVQYLNGASTSLRSQLGTAYPNLWTARYAFQAPNNDPNSPQVQTAHPKDTFSGFYGLWDDPPNPTHPWAFWQYASTGRLQSFNNGNSNLDFNAAQGGVEFVKDHLVPALWMNDQSGEWTDLANWNSGQSPIIPIQGPGQVSRVGPLTLPTPRLPGTDDTLRNVSGANDTVILDRPGASITVTHSSGTHEVRKLLVREALDITGGSLTVNYDPASWDSPLKPLWFAHGPGETINVSAQFSAPVSLSGSGALSVHTLRVDAGRVFTLDGGTLTFDTIELMPEFRSPALMAITGDVNVAPLGTATATIANGAGSGNSGRLSLTGGNRTFHVADGPAAVDLSVDVPIINGGLTKAGPGTMRISTPGTYSGDTIVEAGTLRISNPFLDEGADVHLATGAVLDLDFVGTDTIRSLFIDGDSLPVGTWGASGNPTADFTSALISGTGLLDVTMHAGAVALPGDFNGDGLVDAADYAVWRDGLGTEFAMADYDDWRTTFGQSAGAGVATGATATAAVPEPTSLALLLLAAAALLATRRRRPATTK